MNGFRNKDTFIKCMLKSFGAKGKKLHPSLLKEVHFLFLANAFIKMYVDGTDKKYDKVESLLNELSKKSKIFSKQLDKSLAVSFGLFDEIENIELKRKNKPMRNRFEKRLSFNDKDELEVHGLLFAVCMILDHKLIDSRQLHLPYSLALDIYNDFGDQKGIIYRNARLLPSLFKEYLYV